MSPPTWMHSVNLDAHCQKRASILVILPQSSHTPTHLIYLSEVLPHHNPPQKPNPFLHRPKLQTVLTQKMKMKKITLKTVKMTSWMSKTRRTMKRRLFKARKTSWKTVKRRQKCWQQNA